MTDNVQITQGTGTTVATDDVGGVHYQVVKVAAGAADSATLVSTTNPLPVIQQNAEKAEDAAHSSGDKGIMALAVRKDTAAALAGTDGDYAPLEVDASGSLHVTTRANYADNATFTRTSSILTAGLAGIYESTVSTLTAGKVALARLTGRGAVVVARDVYRDATELAYTTLTGTEYEFNLCDDVYKRTMTSLCIGLRNALDQTVNFQIKAYDSGGSNIGLICTGTITAGSRYRLVAATGSTATGATTVTYVPELLCLPTFRDASTFSLTLYLTYSSLSSGSLHVEEIWRP